VGFGEIVLPADDGHKLTESEYLVPPRSKLNPSRTSDVLLWEITTTWETGWVWEVTTAHQSGFEKLQPLISRVWEITTTWDTGWVWEITAARGLGFEKLPPLEIPVGFEKLPLLEVWGLINYHHLRYWLGLRNYRHLRVGVWEITTTWDTGWVWENYRHLRLWGLKNYRLKMNTLLVYYFPEI
jgi:hypothetical protein